MNLAAIGIITFKGFHLRVVSAEKFHNPPQHQCQEKNHSTRYEPADIAVFVFRLKPLLFTTVPVFFSTATGTGIISIRFHGERLKRKFK